MSISALERIVIIDDEPNARESYELTVEDADFAAYSPVGPLGGLQSFAAQSMDHAGAICDFHLGVRNFASFSGAELVAEWYRSNVPAVLCTKFERAQLDRIRPYRRWIPCLLTPSELTSSTLKSSLEIALGEFDGVFLPSRRPHRALIRVDHVDSDDPGLFLFAMPGWSPETMLPYRINDLPTDLRPQIVPGFRTHVMSNIGAPNFEDLYFTEWGC